MFCSLDCMVKNIRSYVRDPIETVPVPTKLPKTKEYRSKFEQSFRAAMATRGVFMAYEPFAIRLQSGERYVPDFHVPDFEVLVECKGYWGTGGKTKLQQVLRELPMGTLLLAPWYMNGKLR